MMKKNIKMIILIITLMSICIDTVSAVTWGTNKAHTIKPNPTPTPTEEPPTAGTITTRTSGDTTTTYQCLYYANTKTSVESSLNVYDKNNENLIPNDFVFPEGYSSLAGTSVGINFKDIKTVTWYVAQEDVWVEKTTTTKNVVTGYICHYEFQKPNQTPGGNNTNNGNSLNQRLSYYSNNNVEQTAFQKCASKTVGKLDQCKEIETRICKYRGKYEEITDDQTSDPINIKNGSFVSNKNDRDALRACNKEAIQAAINKADEQLKYGASYEINMTNSNDINGENLVISVTEANSYEKECRNQQNQIVNNCSFSYTDSNLNNLANTLQNRQVQQVQGKMTTIREYKKEKTCINVKTGEVSYVPTYDKNDALIKSDCDPTTELTIKNDIVNREEHWHYFIPLNAKSISDVEIDVKRNATSKIDAQTCLDYMESYPIDGPDKIKYTDIIVKYNKANNTIKNFIGDYKSIYNNSTSAIRSKDWNTINSMIGTENEEAACKLTTKVKIPITQEFYNEVKTGANQAKFNGFNFYYKPIDPSNENTVNIIFPNGVTKDENGELTFNSLWSNWYKSLTTNGIASPDLSNSYSQVTYYTAGINVDKVRKYNQANLYTDWTNMSIDGTSDFIDSEGIIKRTNILATNVYKLGCGPANIQTQEGCGIK